ncbi:Hypothetical predicted protein [Octopus vulgaris]|uniref:Uncharacterized protein n=1 Tax=Octopus vulgaris TaxID=6645 RepID=A0AA36EVP8_OCTVU|nr:Hypothetical predicted protein [Octopus vulgaris]
MPSSTDTSQHQQKSTINTEVAEIRQMISALSREKAGIKTSVCAKPPNEGSYQSALLNNLPVALMESRCIEEATESTTHEIIVIRVSEDMVDLQAFTDNTSMDLSCVPPKSASYLGRPGSKTQID